MVAPSNFDTERLLAHYRTMARIRAFEETAEHAHKEGHVKGAVHLSIGQEAVAAGVCIHLGHQDLITTTHRGHGHTIAGSDFGVGGVQKYAAKPACGQKHGARRNRELALRSGVVDHRTADRGAG